MTLNKDIKALVNQVSTITRDSIEQGMAASIKRVIEDGLAGVKDLQKREWGIIRFWLRSVRINEPHAKPFRMYYSDLSAYINH